MAYDGKLLRLAQQEFEKDKAAREAEFQERRERIFRRQPRLKEIDGLLRSTTSRIISGALRRGSDPTAAIAALREENLSLQAEKADLLSRMGLPMDCLDEVPACPPVRRQRILRRQCVPLFAKVLCPRAAEGTQPHAGSGQPEFRFF